MECPRKVKFKVTHISYVSEKNGVSMVRVFLNILLNIKRKLCIMCMGSPAAPSDFTALSDLEWSSSKLLNYIVMMC